ncbi:hypothetical protein PAXRUDRAFT_824751 [Paxillus rubicundulus Ve08.2h10]|uniref:Unplaced genomic scaffold scaffold_105, whole genome shotgun sequence n=1 Tax=Paxillus rubicundulus Ve08.2h10 TaxID=930991 RepID=A0A0D0E7E2_9AGAM|nr:hypothetical protein PAXRUDRAFT_824751 [Paxillus rubicundulus Ve08.2h10]
MFCVHLLEQLAVQEEKKKNTGQLNGDGLPRFLSGNNFYNHVVEHQNACETEKATQEDHHKRKDAYSELVTEEAYHDVMCLWKEES